MACSKRGDANFSASANTGDDKNRPPILSKARDAISKPFGADLARALVLDDPAAIVSGQPLPFLAADQTKDRKRSLKDDIRNHSTS